MHAPLVTIGALNYNNGRFVIEALNSVAAQTYAHIELVIIDDCSTDGSCDLIKEWLKTYTGPYKLIEHPVNKGIHEGYHSIIKNAGGEYLSIFATDDVLLPEKTQEQVDRFLSLDSSYGIVYGDIQEIDEHGGILKEPNFRLKKESTPGWSLPQGNIFPDLLEEFVFYVQASLFKKQFLDEEFFSFPEKFISEDWFFLLFLSRRCKASGMDKVVAKYRILSTSISRLVWTNEKYHQWALSNAKMFIRVSQFAGNTKAENSRMQLQIQHFLLKYAYHTKSVYRESVKSWWASLHHADLKNVLKTLFYIHWFPLKRKLGLEK